VKALAIIKRNEEFGTR